MTTFSQLVDSAVLETKRPDLRQEICNYLNQTIRELHFEPSRNNVIHYRENLREALLSATSDAGFGWEIPNPANFQGMAAVRYDTVWDRLGGQVFAREVTPSRALAGQKHFFYRAGQRFNFSDYGGQNAMIAIAWYEYPARLLYKSVSERYCQYDAESGWSYPAGLIDPELQLAARTLSSNWLLLRWVDVVAEGLRAKIYKRLSDTDRARTCYSMFNGMRQGLFTSEVADLGGVR